MSELTIKLTKPMKAFLEARARESGHSDPGDYVADAIRKAQRNRDRIDAALMVSIEAVESGEVSEMTSADLQKFRDRIREKHFKGASK